MDPHSKWTLGYILYYRIKLENSTMQYIDCNYNFTAIIYNRFASKYYLYILATIAIKMPFIIY